MPNACADVAKLLTASRAVPDLLRQTLDLAPQRLSTDIEDFNSATQEPRVIARVPEELSEEARVRISEGEGIDTFLARTAEAFLIAGHSGRPPGFIGPVVPGSVAHTDIVYADEQKLSKTLEKLNRPLSDPLPTLLADETFPDDGKMRRRDGKTEIKGPGGQWYVVSTTIPYRGALISSWEGPHDFGNSHLWLEGSAHVVTLGEVESVRPAPPRAYQHITFDINGNALIEIPAKPAPLQPYKPPPGDAPADPATADRGARVGARVDLFSGALAGFSQGAHLRYSGNMAARVQYYVDPSTGQRVAVVDAVSIGYNDDNDPVVATGRMTFDERGHPSIVARPPDPGDPCVTGDHPVISSAPDTVRTR